MKDKLTLDVINKIINNCKIGSEFVSQEEDQDFEFYDIRVFKDNDFKQYTVMHYFQGDEEYQRESWSIFEESGTDILEDYNFAINFDDEDYSLEDWKEEYSGTLEENKEVIELVEKYNNTDLEL